MKIYRDVLMTIVAITLTLYNDEYFYFPHDKLSKISMSVCYTMAGTKVPLSISLSFCLSIYLSFYLSTYLSTYLPLS